MNETLIRLSDNALFTSFLLYMLAMFSFLLSVTARKKQEKRVEQRAKWAKIGFVITVIAVASHLLYIIVRTIAGGHFPVSNMFEFMTFLSFSIALGFIIIFAIYRKAFTGAFALPLVIIIQAYASMFPSEIPVLIPALQSYWLPIHVSTAALGQGLFAVGCAAGIWYLISQVPQDKPTRSNRTLEGVLLIVFMLVGYIITGLYFNATGYEANFQLENGATMTYNKPALAGPYDGVLVTEGAMQPWFNIPTWMQGVKAAVKFNTIVWSFLSGIILYLLLRLIARKRLGAVMRQWMLKTDADLVDEISYRAIAIGFPVYTLGALLFAMIWAHEAWGRFWGWDPKEVWALITWLFYSVYLHLRLSRGWQGEKSAWLAVLGFIIVMITLVFVNLVIVGLHSYA